MSEKRPLEPIKIPEMLRGRWEHAIFFSYGFDPLFFEHHLLGLLGDGCRNRLVLADGGRLRETFMGYAENSAVLTHLNHRYVAAGIENRQAAHAKLVLLASGKRGRLLVGSGNLNLNGYTSGGEQFVCYDWSEDDNSYLPAFKTALDLLRQLRADGLIGGEALVRLDHFERNVSWINASVGDADRPVRHNLNRSFLNQFVDAVGQRPVDELVVMAPFYDPKADALAQMMTLLKPTHTRVIVQRGYTSVDPAALQQVLAAGDGTYEVLEANLANEEHTPYLHAKFYLAKLKEASICLAGSPNLSRRAMLHTVTNGRGNIELANLLIGKRGQFDTVFDPLVLTPVELDDPKLDIAYRSDPIEPEAEAEKHGLFKLTRGVLAQHELTLDFAGDLPCDIALCGLLVDQEPQMLPTHFVLSDSRDQLIVKVTDEVLTLLDRPVAVCVAWSAGEETCYSNPVFIYHQAHLQHELNLPASSGTLERMGSTHLADEELELLLEELLETMVIEADQLWQMVGKKPQAALVGSNQDASSGVYSYADIDDAALENHPKMRQYRQLSTSLSARSSPIATMLASILDNFNGLIEAAQSGSNELLQTQMQVEIAADEEGEFQNEAEAEAGEINRHRQKEKNNKRLLREFKKFINRFLTGLESPAYQEKVGSEVITANYIAFSFLLYKLWDREFFQENQVFLLENMLKVIELIWGSADSIGYLQTLDSDTQTKVLERIAKHHNPATVLAVFYLAKGLMQKNVNLKVKVRDCLQLLVLSPRFPTNRATVASLSGLVKASIKINAPTPSKMYDVFSELMQFKSADEFLEGIENKIGGGYFSLKHIGNPADKNKQGIELELTKPDFFLGEEGAKKVIQRWISFRPENNPPTYYRVVVKNKTQTEQIASYFFESQEFYYVDKTRPKFSEEDLEQEPSVLNLAVSETPQWKSEFDSFELAFIEIEIEQIEAEEARHAQNYDDIHQHAST